MKKAYGKCWVIPWLIILALIGGVGVSMLTQCHWKVALQKETFTESARAVQNPERGLYQLYGFWISDDAVDYREQVAQKMADDTDTSLAMIQINLQAYRSGKISPTGLDHIQKLFEALKPTGKKLIVRFLYDWDGKNAQFEPSSLNIVLQHMRQLEPVLKRSSSQIYVLQGIFIGNWGEMNGSRYLSAENMKALIDQLAAVTDKNTFLAVRMPAQWRTLTKTDATDHESLLKNGLAARLSLFNDGMLGNEGDYGTYGTKPRAESDPQSCWCRKDEIAFQNQLCLYVPNGGEAINDNPVNDFENAVKDLAAMHVTYLAAGYDQNVYKKWAKSKVTSDGCFTGMDGYNYIVRHLGYRILISDAALSYKHFLDAVSVSVNLKNVGFAPLYQKKDAELVVVDAKTGKQVIQPFQQDLRSLAGGSGADNTMNLSTRFSLRGMDNGTYRLYFRIMDPESGTGLELANAQKAERYGYEIGTMELKG